MKTFIPGPLADTARNLMRRAGYGEHRGHEAQLSYVRRIQGTPFPRYHAYVEDRDGGMQLNLHLDQKEASHAGSHAHAGEYEGPVVEREQARIMEMVRGMGAAETGGREPEGTRAEGEIPKKKTGGFFGWLFGG